MPSVVLSPAPILAFWDNAGKPLVGGKLQSFQAGTNTPLPTYTDSTGTFQNTNPIVLNSRGEVAYQTGQASGLWIPPNTAYKFVLSDSLDNQIWSIDNVTDVQFVFDRASLGNAFYPPSDAEIAFGAIITNPWLDYGNVDRYGADPTETDDSTQAINTALACNDYAFSRGGKYLVTGTAGGCALHSNQTFEGFNGATLSINADTTFAITGTSITNVTVRGWQIDGNGSTGTAGFKGTRGIYFDGVTNFEIDHCTITAVGCMNSIPTNDAGFGGFGIIIINNAGNSFSGVVSNCFVSQIAGGGTSAGDGICLTHWAGSALLGDIAIRDCTVSICGRDCYSISTSTGNPTDVTLSRCYGSQSSSAGLDIEEGSYVTVDDCHFILCGNDQTFFNPLATFGATYRLLTGVATGNLSIDVNIKGCHFDRCYYGITYGATQGLLIDGNYVESSTKSDIALGTATGAYGMRLINNRFLTSLDCLGFNSAVPRYDFVAQGNVFAGRVTLSALNGGLFSGNTFGRSLAFTGTGISNITIADNSFYDWAGPSIDLSQANIAAQDLQVIGNKFLGAGNLTYGIQIGFNGAVRMIAKANTFTAATIAGIGITNGDGIQVFANVEGNQFVGGVGGIVCPSQGIINGVIANNTFQGITGWCIDFSSIGANTLDSMTMVNNIAGAGVVNGLRIALSTGTWDHTILIGNNFHNASGTKWTIPAGNANGFVANNITT